MQQQRIAPPTAPASHATAATTRARLLTRGAIVVAVLLAALPVMATSGCADHTYAPCAGKKAGAACRACPQNDGACVETMEVKTCNADGACTSSPSRVAVRPDPNDGHPWLIDTGGGVCASWMGATDGPDGALWVGTGAGVFRLAAPEPNSTFPLGGRPTEVGGVRALHRGVDAVYVDFGGSEVIEFAGASATRTSLGTGISAPMATSDNGCVAVRRGDELVVRSPGEGALRTAPIPRPKDGRELVIESVVGTDDGFLVRTFRHSSGELGAVYRVSCPGVAVAEVASGRAVANLDDFARGNDGSVWAIDRYNASGGASHYRLMRSEDQGKTWAAASVPPGWQSWRVAVRGPWVVAAAPKMDAVLLSVDGGKNWSLEPIETHSAVGEFYTLSVHVSDRGVVTLGGNCNYLIHRRAPLSMTP